MSSLARHFEAAGAIVLALLWICPLLFAFWAAFHTTSDAVNFNILAPWTLDNFRTAWAGAPWLRYFLNTFLLVTLVLAGQFVLTTLAGYFFLGKTSSAGSFMSFHGGNAPAKSGGGSPAGRRRDGHRVGVHQRSREHERCGRGG